MVPYDVSMNIRSVQHRGLKRFIEDDDDRGLWRDLVDRIRKILAVSGNWQMTFKVEDNEIWQVNLEDYH